MNKLKIQFKTKPPISYIQCTFLVLLCILAYSSSNKVMIQLFLVTLSAFILDGIYFCTKKCHVDLQSDSVVQKGESYIVHIKLNNLSILPTPFIHVYMHDTVQMRLTSQGKVSLLLGPKEQFTRDIYYEAHLSGETTIGIESIHMVSFLGFFSKRIPIELYTRARILPEMRKITNIQAFTEAMRLDEGKISAINNQDTHSLGEEIGYELKSYKEGDSQRLIHWKIAAQRDLYLVRQREMPMGQGKKITLILNPLKKERDSEAQAIIHDRQATILVSMAYHFLLAGCEVKVVYNIGKKCKTIILYHESDIRELQELLSYYQNTDQDTCIPEFIMNYVGPCVVISEYWEDALSTIRVDHAPRKKQLTIVWSNPCISIPNGEIDHHNEWEITKHFKIKPCDM